MRTYRNVVTTRLLFIGAAMPLIAALPLSAVSIALSPPSAASHPVGIAVQWAAMNAGSASTKLQYRWVITQNGTTVVFRDFNTTPTITYAPVQEGLYTVTVTARDAANPAETDTFSFTHRATSLLTSSAPKVTATNNPLVAIYSATCTSGDKIRVFFAPAGTLITSGFATPTKACVTGQSVNFIIAGMREDTTYTLQHQIQSGFNFSFGPAQQFKTGSIPSTVTLPKLAITGTPTTQQPVVLESAFAAGSTPTMRSFGSPVAFDLTRNVIWYTLSSHLLWRPVNGGTMFLGEGDEFQKIDLLGNVLRETNITRVQEQLPFINGKTNRVADFNHDAIQLPNGDVAVISLMEQITNQGPPPNPKDVLGDLVLVLDKNDYHVKWSWNPFGRVKLPITRLATLGDTCSCTQTGSKISCSNGCPVLKLIPLGTPANDWMHANSLAFTGDNDLLLSVRSQDWVLKLDYNNGSGTGNIVWRFGNQGDFTLPPGQIWFSHQHNATLQGTTLFLYDDHNAQNGAPFGGSRGVVFTINEERLNAEIADEALMHAFSPAFGTAQILLNGNLWFLAGVLPGGTSEAIEFKPGSMATPIAQFSTNNNNYRSFRMKDLYTP